MDHTLLVSLLARLSLPELATLVACNARDTASRVIAELGHAKLDGSYAHEAAVHFALRAVVAWAHSSDSRDDAGLAMGLLDEAEHLFAIRGC